MFGIAYQAMDYQIRPANLVVLDSPHETSTSDHGRIYNLTNSMTRSELDDCRRSCSSVVLKEVGGCCPLSKRFENQPFEVILCFLKL